MDSNLQTEKVFNIDAEGRRRRTANQDYIDRSKEGTKQVIENVVGMLPAVGTAMTIEDIKEELKKENPSYGKIALLGGSEVIGLIPGLGTAAKTGLRAAAKKIGVDKLIKAIDAPKPEEAVKLEAGFTGTNPPTYKERLPNTEVSKVGTILFDKPILEYINSLDYPSKGLKGSDFIKLVEQNPSISTTSFQRDLINPQKRYSSKELNDLFNRNEFDTLAVLERQPRFEKEQRQKSVGFDGGKEVEYFDIPIKARAYPFESLPRDKRLKKFKPKGDLHGYPESTIVHIRGSIIDPLGDYSLAPNVLLDRDRLPTFDAVINDEPFLLVEEIQSDLLQKGYVKPKSTDDAIYSQAKAYFDDDYIAIKNYDEAFEGLDQEIRSIVKEVDKENPDLPQMFVEEFNITKGLKGEDIVDKDPLVLDVDESGLSREQILRYGEDVDIFPDADIPNYYDDDVVEGAVSAAELTDFKFRDYLLEKLQDRGLDKEVDPSDLRNFYGNYRSVISDIKEDGIDKFYENIDVALPPITKNRQAVEEALKVSIAKAASKGVNKIVIPNPTRIALARNREPRKVIRSGDRFGRTYNKDLKVAIEDLRDNYPVSVSYDELPYNDKKLMTSMKSMLEPLPSEYTRAYAAGDPVDNMGYILDITELVKKYRVESPRQFAEGGDTVRPEPRPEAEIDVSPRAEAGDQFFVKEAERKRAFEKKPKPRPSMDKSFPNVKPKQRPEGRSEFITRGYEVDGREVQVGIIKFKGGEEIALDKVIENIDVKGTANEPVITKNTVTQVLNFIEQNNPTREEFETYWYNKRLNKGGMIDDQMQMAFMDKGGLTDDGMDIDPVSGNDIPSGSMAEEVRDDIPAQLSDGEYVVPADVVRYYGVKFFEDLRDQAKMGLAEMEVNGRIGGEPVPDGGPMNTQELSPEEMQAIQEIMGMSNGGSVESDMLGGQTSAQVEQDILAQGSAAKAQNYTGIPLGSTIFDPVNTNTGVQQTEAKAFTPVVLYNTAGQTRTVNSAEERKSAEAAGFTMTLEQYNMYRSQRGGSGGSGGGSGIITPPGEEDKESKPWGEGTDWNNEDSIREFVKNAQEGNIEGASGRFLRGLGFALLGMTGVGLVGALQTFQGKQTLADMQTAQEIARANGTESMNKLADEIQTDINTYLKTAGGAINFMNDIFGPSTSQADRWARTQGFDTLEDYAAAQEDKKRKPPVEKKAPIKVDRPAPPPGYAPSGVSTTTQKIQDSIQDKLDRDKAEADASAASGPTTDFAPGGIGVNKGGLMTKGKKKK